MCVHTRTAERVSRRTRSRGFDGPRKPGRNTDLDLAARLLDLVLHRTRFVEDVLGRLQGLLALLALLLQLHDLGLERHERLVLLLVLAGQLREVRPQLALLLVTVELLAERRNLSRSGPAAKPTRESRRTRRWRGGGNSTDLAVQLPPRPLVEIDENGGVALNDADGVLATVRAAVPLAGQVALGHRLEARDELSELWAGGDKTMHRVSNGRSEYTGAQEHRKDTRAQGRAWRVPSGHGALRARR